MLFVILCLALQNFSVCCMTYYSAKTQENPLSKFSASILLRQFSLFQHVPHGWWEAKQAFNAHFCPKYNLKLFN